MDAIAPPETFGIDGVEFEVADLRGQRTYGEVVIGWLDAIYQTVAERGCVHLIGTHLDKVRDELSKKSKTTKQLTLQASQKQAQKGFSHCSRKTHLSALGALFLLSSLE